MYDAEMGFPGLIIDGTACVGGEGEPPSLSESNEDMVVGWRVEGKPRSETPIKLDACYMFGRGQGEGNPGNSGTTHLYLLGCWPYKQTCIQSAINEYYETHSITTTTHTSDYARYDLSTLQPTKTMIRAT